MVISINQLSELQNQQYCQISFEAKKFYNFKIDGNFLSFQNRGNENKKRELVSSMQTFLKIGSSKL